MGDARALCGDHSFKFAKMVYIAGGRAFEGLFVLMNGVGRVIGFWFTSGTSMSELEPVFRGVARRMKMHGFTGPLLYTTDRCCDEKSFFDGSKTDGQSPIFEMFAKHGVTLLSEPSSDSPTLSLPEPPLLVPADLVTMTNVCAQIREAAAESDGVIGLDTEWTLGSPTPQVVQIGLADGRTFLFQIRCRTQTTCVRWE